jgi:hypothetical protein
MNWPRNDTILFDAEISQPEELASCQIGDYVNLWVPEDDSRIVYIFRRGSIGGGGRIGYVPGQYSRIISAHLDKGLEYETEIVEISFERKRCRIKCRLISKEETATRREKEPKLPLIV